jgi:cephalosporin-C deacetylase-like acetyl esterase
VVGQDGAYEVTDAEFDAEGATLRGWLYRPRSQTSPAPVVFMAHGYNCLKEFYLDKYAASIAAPGTSCLPTTTATSARATASPGRSSFQRPAGTDGA